MELHLSRKIAEKRVFPAITTTVPVPVKKSCSLLRKNCRNVDPAQNHSPDGRNRCNGILINKLAMTKTNDDFFEMMKRHKFVLCQKRHVFTWRFAFIS